MKHLYSNQCHDESEVWCDKADYYGDGEPTPDPSKADCKPCLEAAAAFGARAAERLRKLRPKDWNACPYASHADDCDCGGSGGDR